MKNATIIAMASLALGIGLGLGIGRISTSKYQLVVSEGYAYLLNTRTREIHTVRVHGKSKEWKRTNFRFQ